MVLVDTPIWSLALRRSALNLNPNEQLLTAALRELISDSRARIIGPVRQELLSGIRIGSMFTRLRDHLRAFDEPTLETADFEQAAHFHNRCRSRGIVGSPIDFLIGAVALRREWQVFTTDRDFSHFARVVAVKLYEAK